METGYRFALKGTQSPLMGRERTGTEPRKDGTSRSQNPPESGSTTWHKPTCCLNFPSLILLKLDVLTLMIQFYTEKDHTERAHI